MKILNVNKRTYLGESCIDIEITAVLTEGAIGDLAAYIGEGSPEWIAKYGNKLSYKEATCHFPNIEETKYRG